MRCRACWRSRATSLPPLATPMPSCCCCWAGRSAWRFENARLFRRLKRVIAELSTPIMPVAEGVLVLPLIGTIDAERAQRTTEQVLEEIVARQAETLLIDVTGVAQVDAFVVDQLLKLVRTAGLLGTRCSIVGISAAMARTFVELGLDVGGLQTFSDLQSALAAILGKVRSSERRAREAECMFAAVGSRGSWVLRVICPSFALTPVAVLWYDSRGCFFPSEPASACSGRCVVG